MGRLALILLLTVLGCAPDVPLCDDCLVLYDVTIIDGLGKPPVEHQVIVIRDGLISEISTVSDFEDPPSNSAMDVAGMFVMPGLIDMHAHVTILPMNEEGGLASNMDRAASEAVLATLLDFGITTVRNPAAPTVDAIELRGLVAEGIVAGPQIVTAGSALNRTSASFGPFVSTPTLEAIRAEVARQATLGVDYLKVYSSLPPEFVQVAIEAAHNHGLEVIGHLQRTTWTEATRLGIDHIAHGAPWSAYYLPEDRRANYNGTLKDRMFWLENVDFSGPAIREMIQLMAVSGVTVDPTLVAYRTKFYGDDPHYLSNADSVFAPPLVRDIWARGAFTSDWSADDYSQGHAVWPQVLELTKALYDGGVLLTAGSDTPNPWVIPGVSLHEELQLLHDAGIPAINVLRIATNNGAVSLGLDERIGSVEVGKEADLLVLRANPLNDLSNTREIAFVLVNGMIVD